MKTTRNIIIVVALWVVCTGAVFGYVVPKFSSSLIGIQKDHQKQMDTLKDLKEQVQALQKIQEDLTKVDSQDVKPSDLFTSDIRLVNEIKTIEQFAQKNSLEETLAISGTADKAVAVQSASGLSQVPYSITLKGSFPNVLNFMKYLENAYFISPVNGFSISYKEKGIVSATILTNFYIHK